MHATTRRSFSGPKLDFAPSTTETRPPRGHKRDHHAVISATTRPPRGHCDHARDHHAVISRLNDAMSHAAPPKTRPPGGHLGQNATTRRSSTSRNTRQRPTQHQKFLTPAPHLDSRAKHPPSVRATTLTPQCKKRNKCKSASNTANPAPGTTGTQLRKNPNAPNSHANRALRFLTPYTDLRPSPYIIYFPTIHPIYLLYKLYTLYIE
jgi:hypothetical protein